MNKLFKFSFFAAIFAIALISFSCNDEKGKEMVSDVKFDQSPPFVIEVGGTLTVTAKITPASLIQKVEYSLASSNTAVATAKETVEDSQVSIAVTGHSPGKATITLTVKYESIEYPASIEVTVVAKPVIEVESISLDIEMLTLNVGDAHPLTATIMPVNATDKTVTWRSQDIRVATVNDEGLVTAVNPGMSTIEAIAVNGKMASMVVVVTEMTTSFPGKGTEDEPYEISTAAQLALMAKWVNEGKEASTQGKISKKGELPSYDAAYYILTADINLSAYQSGKGWIPIRPFYGTFDGNKHTVSGLLINDNTLGYAGLFGYIEGGTVKNLGVTGEITAEYNAGGLAGGIGEGSIIINCFSTVKISAITGVGGLVGSAAGNITNCYTTGSICKGSSNVGGVVGGIGYCIISNCYSTSAVSVDDKFVGGVGGQTEDATVRGCAALNPSITASEIYYYFVRVAYPFSGCTFTDNVAWAGLPKGGADYGGNYNGTDITSAQAKLQVTYTGIGWKFGNNDANPWKMGVGSYPLPVFYWQTTAPAANLDHLK